MKPGDLVRALAHSKTFTEGQEGEVLSVYDTLNGLGGAECFYKVRFREGAICVVRANEVEGALGA